MVISPFQKHPVRSARGGGRAWFLSIDLLPLPDDEAVAHALFEIAARREAIPPDDEALEALIKKYTTVVSGSTS
jgi:hypothetical protein